MEKAAQHIRRHTTPHTRLRIRNRPQPSLQIPRVLQSAREPKLPGAVHKLQILVQGHPASLALSK